MNIQINCKENVDKNYIEIQLIEQKIWNDLENIYTLVEKDTAKQWDQEYYIMLGRYDLAKEIKDYLDKKCKTILSDEELKNQEATQRKINELLVQRYSNSISLQKIKDKIEEYKNMLKTCNKAKDIDRIKAINERILELQELIEGEK